MICVAGVRSYYHEFISILFFRPLFVFVCNPGGCQAYVDMVKTQFLRDNLICFLPTLPCVGRKRNSFLRFSRLRYPAVWFSYVQLYFHMETGVNVSVLLSIHVFSFNFQIPARVQTVFFLVSLRRSWTRNVDTTRRCHF